MLSALDARGCVAAGCVHDARSAAASTMPAVLYINCGNAAATARHQFFGHFLVLRESAATAAEHDALIDAAAGYSRSHGIRWWLLELAGGTEAFLTRAPVRLASSVSKHRIRVALLSVWSMMKPAAWLPAHVGSSPVPSFSATELFKGVAASLPFDLLLSYVHPSGLPLGLAPYSALLPPPPARRRVEFAPHLAGLIARASLGRVVQARRPLMHWIAPCLPVALLDRVHWLLPRAGARGTARRGATRRARSPLPHHERG